MSDKPIDFALARFDREDRSPSNHTPEETVRAFLGAVASGRINPDHVIISYSQVQDGERGDSGYFQGGRLDYLGQMGLLTRVINLMNLTGEE